MIFVSCFQLVGHTKNYLRPFSSIICQTPFVHNSAMKDSAQNSKVIPIGLTMRHFQTSSMFRDMETAAKYIGAGAATIGVAGSGIIKINYQKIIVFKKSQTIYCFYFKSFIYNIFY